MTFSSTYPDSVRAFYHGFLETDLLEFQFHPIYSFKSHSPAFVVSDRIVSVFSFNFFVFIIGTLLSLEGGLMGSRPVAQLGHGACG